MRSESSLPWGARRGRRPRTEHPHRQCRHRRQHAARQDQRIRRNGRRGNPEAIRPNGYLDSARCRQRPPAAQPQPGSATWCQLQSRWRSTRPATSGAPSTSPRSSAKYSPRCRRRCANAIRDHRRYPEGIVMDAFRAARPDHHQFRQQRRPARLRRTPHRQHHPARQPTAEGEGSPLGQR